MDTFATLLNGGVIRRPDDPAYLTVSAHYFTQCHRAAVARIQFDEVFYILRYPDVADAVAAAAFASAQEHYVVCGYYEHRMPYEIMLDEDWYLDAYADVRRAVLDGVFASGQDHFDALGFAEGRMPYPHFSLKTLGAGR